MCVLPPRLIPGRDFFMPLLHIIPTSDGSQTLYNEEIGEAYHSTNGALQEAEHVFLKQGLQYLLNQNKLSTVNILEVGFGSGLNFLVSADYAALSGINLRYTGIEAFPLSREIISRMGYEKYCKVPGLWDRFIKAYKPAQQEEQHILPGKNIYLEIFPGPLLDYTPVKLFDLIYYDAFAPARQPDMWTAEPVEKVCDMLKPGGILVTYSITGSFKRLLKKYGMSIEKPPGAAGKREMLRATKK